MKEEVKNEIDGLKEYLTTELESIKQMIKLLDKDKKDWGHQENLPLSWPIIKESVGYIVENSLSVQDLSLATYVMDKVPNLNEEPTLRLLYRATRDGFEPQTFHSLCDNEGPTVSFVRTSKGFLFGCYTRLPWQSRGGHQLDTDARLFALTGETITYKPMYSQRAVYHGEECSLSFGQALEIQGRAGKSWTRNRDNAGYNVGADAQGNSRLTGDGAGKLDNQKTFKVEEIEVFLIE